jgi:hypothetical protein
LRQYWRQQAKLDWKQYLRGGSYPHQFTDLVLAEQLADQGRYQ